MSYKIVDSWNLSWIRSHIYQYDHYIILTRPMFEDTTERCCTTTRRAPNSLWREVFEIVEEESTQTLGVWNDMEEPQQFDIEFMIIYDSSGWFQRRYANWPPNPLRHLRVADVSISIPSEEAPWHAGSQHVSFWHDICFSFQRSTMQDTNPN